MNHGRRPGLKQPTGWPERMRRTSVTDISDPFPDSPPFRPYLSETSLAGGRLRPGPKGSRKHPAIVLSRRAERTSCCFQPVTGSPRSFSRGLSAEFVHFGLAFERFFVLKVFGSRVTRSFYMAQADTQDD